MAERRSERDTRFAIAAAFDIARECGHQSVGTEHLLLGLCRRVPRLFQREGGARAVEQRVYALIGRPTAAPSGHARTVRPYTDRAKRALRYGLREAKRRGAAARMEPQDLVNGLIVEADGIGSTVLQQAGYVVYRQPAATERDDSWNRAIDLLAIADESEIPYFEQIIARVRDAVAAGELLPGDRLPPVRRLADALDLAPGTVARAYSELEENGVVETGGAKGTTIAVPGSANRTSAEDRLEELAGLLRPVAVAAFHLGGSVDELFEALRLAIVGVFEDPPHNHKRSA